MISYFLTRQTLQVILHTHKDIVSFGAPEFGVTYKCAIARRPIDPTDDKIPLPETERAIKKDTSPFEKDKIVNMSTIKEGTYPSAKRQRLNEEFKSNINCRNANSCALSSGHTSKISINEDAKYLPLPPDRIMIGELEVNALGMGTLPLGTVVSGAKLLNFCLFSISPSLTFGMHG